MNSESPPRKVIFLGKAGVGKTSLVHRLAKGSFPAETNPTIGGVFTSISRVEEFERKTLNLWDTAGQERFNSMLPLFTRGSHIVCICFDKPDLNEIMKYVNIAEVECPQARIVFVQTKCDIPKRLTHRTNMEKKVREHAFESGTSYFKVSAMNNIQIDDFTNYLYSCTIISLDNFEDEIDIVDFEDESMFDINRTFRQRWCCR